MFTLRSVSRSISCFLFTVLVGSTVLAMISPATSWARRGDAPLTYRGFGKSLTSVNVLPVSPPDVAKLRAQDEIGDGTKRVRYADPRTVDVTPSTHGTWETLADGSRLWRLLVHSPNATDLNLGFADFDVPAGTRLYVISPQLDYYEGPYTAADNEEHGQLWVPVVPGDQALIEMQLPAATKFEPRLRLTHVGYGYKDIFKRDPQTLGKQGTCNNDTICPEGDPWRDQIQAVAVYSIGGSLACTGSMIADVPQSFRNFFLTAWHCGVNGANAASVTVYWNFESANCGDLSGGDLSDNQTGSVFRASRQDVDMCLIELDDDPSPASNVYYAGWDRSNTTPSGSVGIHHPNTDEKAISFNTDALSTRNNCIGGGATNDTHWEVDNWEDGTTEPGSSGSALFDPSNKLIIGFLSGGLAACGNTEFDCYGKFAMAWDGASAASRLRDWLDPNSLAPNQVQGSFPTGVGTLLFSDFSGADSCEGDPGNDIWEPGEVIEDFLVDITAAGGSLTGISGTLSSTTQGVSITQGSSAWINLNANESAANTTAFEVALNETMACFSQVDFVLTLTANEGGPFAVNFSRELGQLTQPSGLPLAIPDNNAAGTTSTLVVADDFTVTDLNVRVAIDHSWVGDLIISLQSPAGTIVELMNRPGVPAGQFGCGDNNLDITFDDSGSMQLETHCAGSIPWFSGVANPSESLAAFNGESTAGSWTLRVSDNATGDSGNVLAWELLSTPGITSGVCEECTDVPVQVSAISLEREGWGARFKWNVARSEGVAGYHVYRNEAGRARHRVTDDLLAPATSFDFVDPTAPTAETQYWIEEIGLDQSTYFHGPFTLAADPFATGTVRLEAGRPNPFRGQISLAYSLREERAVRLAVFDLRGRRVATLVDESQAAGSYTATWNGRGDAGEPVAAGVYFYRLDSEDQVLVRRMSLTR